MSSGITAMTTTFSEKVITLGINFLKVKQFLVESRVRVIA